MAELRQCQREIYRDRGFAYAAFAAGDGDEIPYAGNRLAFRLLHLNMEEITDRFVIDARYHVFEKRESLFLELDDGIFLRVTPQADALFQVIQREQVVLPL